MAEIVVVNFVTVDGVIQSPLFADEDPEGGFDAGGWVQPYMDDVIGRVMAEATTSAGALLLGRKTYQTFAASWSTADQREPAVAALNRMPKYVASTTLATADWQNSHILGADLTAEVARLKRQPGGDIVVFGSGGLLRTLIGSDLVDRYTLLVFPVVLGTGKKMFGDGAGAGPAALSLLTTQSSSTGVVIMRYARRPGSVID
jgi:dihydrofolate reductase